MKRPREELKGVRKLLHDYFLTHVKAGIPVVVSIQKHWRRPLLDWFFLGSGFLGSETFYVALIPLVFWAGATVLAANVLLLLNFGCWVCAFLKDYLSLPRPSSSQVDFMQKHLSREYGCPSSHTCSAVAVSLWTVLHLCSFDTPDGNVWWSIYNTRLVIGLLFALVWIAVLGFGRLYLGVHSPLDVLFGGILGFILFFVHWYFRNAIFVFLDSFPQAFYVSLLVSVALLLIHPRPMEPTSSKKEAITVLASATGVIYGCTNGVMRMEFPHFVGLLLSEYSLMTLTFQSMFYNLSILFFRFLVGYAMMYGTQVFGKKLLYTCSEVVYSAIFETEKEGLEKSKEKPIEESPPQSIARYALLLIMGSISAHFAFQAFDFVGV